MARSQSIQNTADAPMQTQLLTNYKRMVTQIANLYTDAIDQMATLNFYAGTLSAMTGGSGSPPGIQQRNRSRQSPAQVNIGLEAEGGGQGNKLSRDTVVLEAVNAHPDGCTVNEVRPWITTHYPEIAAELSPGQLSLALNRHWTFQRIKAVGQVGKGFTPTFYPLAATVANAVTGPGSQQRRTQSASPTRRTRQPRAAAG